MSSISLFDTFSVVVCPGMAKVTYLDIQKHESVFWVPAFAAEAVAVKAKSNYICLTSSAANFIIVWANLFNKVKKTWLNYFENLSLI